MLIKIFSNKGGGSAKASVDYLLGEKRDREEARVLRGDPDLSVTIAESLSFKNAYTVGCLSFEEPNISEESKDEIMDKFEKTIFAGMETDQYNITWVEHRDKGRLELNFFIPNVELRSDKRFQPYFDKADRPLVDNFKKVINHDYGLTSPDAPEKRQLTKIDLKLPRSAKELKEGLNQFVISQVVKGEIKSQQQIAELFEKSGLEVARVTEKSISIKNPQGGRNLRLDGEFYGKGFYENTRNIAELEKHIGRGTGREPEEDRHDSLELHERTRNKLEQEINKRSEKHHKLYPKQIALERDFFGRDNDLYWSLGLYGLADKQRENEIRQTDSGASELRIVRRIYQSGRDLDNKGRWGALHNITEQESVRIQEPELHSSDEIGGLRGFIDELSKRTKSVIQRVRKKAIGITERARGIAEYMHKADEREQGIERVTGGIRDFNGAVQKLNGESAKHDELIESRKHEIPRTDREINKIERAIEYKEERSQDKGMSMSR